MAKAHKISVTVVVSGARISVAVNTNQKVQHLIRKALDEAGIPHPKVKEWTLRSASGGAAIDPDLSIEEAGIADGATLFLDPDEGGGGEVAVAFGGLPPEPPPPPVLVDPAVSEAKLEHQLEEWQASSEIYAERGWLLLGRDGLDVDVGFCARLPGPVNDIVAIPLAVRIGFQNYDVWAPSVKVIDPITRRWLVLPRVRAVDFDQVDVDGAVIDYFVNRHPDTGRAFLCKVGTREYHSHFEHSGDDWLLYRDQGYGTLGRLCDLLWRTAVRTVAGLNFAVKRDPLAEQVPPEASIEIRQEKAADSSPSIHAQEAQEIPIAQLPPQLRAQLPPEIQALIPEEK